MEATVGDTVDATVGVTVEATVAPLRLQWHR